MAQSLIDPNMLPYLDMSQEDADRMLSQALSTTDHITFLSLFQSFVWSDVKDNSISHYDIMNDVFGIDKTHNALEAVPDYVSKEDMEESVMSFIEFTGNVPSWMSIAGSSEEFYDEYPSEVRHIAIQVESFFEVMDDEYPNKQVTEVFFHGEDNSIMQMRNELSPQADHAHLTFNVPGNDMIHAMCMFNDETNEIIYDDLVLGKTIQECVPFDNASLTIRFHNDDPDGITFVVVAYLVVNGNWVRVGAEELMKSYSYNAVTGEPFELEDDTYYTESSMVRLLPVTRSFADEISSITLADED